MLRAGHLEVRVLSPLLRELQQLRRVLRLRGGLRKASLDARGVGRRPALRADHPAAVVHGLLQRLVRRRDLARILLLHHDGDGFRSDRRSQ